MIRRWLLLVVVLVGAVLASSCAAPAAQPSTPTEAATPTSGDETTKVDLNEIFPPGEGRELVLNNCTNCHVFTPIVILQMNRKEWERNALDHRGRVPALSDEEFKTLYEYLIANFNPDRPVPELPQELLDAWTSY